MSLLKLSTVVSSMLLGWLLLSYSLNLTFKPEQSGSSAEDSGTVDPILIVFSLTCYFFGFFLLLIPLSYLYIHTSTHHNISKSVDHNISKSSDLQILDWALVSFTLLLIPAFEALGLSPRFWIMLVVLPALAARVIVTWEIERRETR